MLTQFAVSDNENYLEAGVDEVARGCLFGPVFAGAVILNKNIPVHPWLNDSKKVTKKRRAVVRKWIEENAICWAVAHVNNDNIDKLNIRQCALAAMEIAIRKLSRLPDLLLVDGDYFHGCQNFGKHDEILQVPVNLNQSLPMNVPYQTVVGGDAIYASIAAASILAKEHHDEMIQKMIVEDPSLNERYHLGTNVGYGTAQHITGLKEFGPTSLHRMSFLGKILTGTKFSPAPVMPIDLLKSDQEEEEEEEEELLEGSK